MIRSKIVLLGFCLCLFSASVFAALLEHTVQKGETLTSISHDFSVTIEEICRENGIPKDTMLKAGQKLKIPAQRIETYKVERGDTLSGIAQKFGMSVADIKQLNKLSDDTIKPGQSLTVYEKDVQAEPDAKKTETHKVEPGETLSGIAREFGMSVADIKQLNNLSDDTIKTGQQIKVYKTAAQAEPAAPKIETYTVEPGDTLFSIARKFGMSVPSLKELNSLSSDTIKAGQSLAVNSALPELIDPRSFGKQGDVSLVWPVKPMSVTYITGKISGVQLETKRDEDVISISNGEVMFSELYHSYGLVVFVQNSPYVYGYTGLADVSVQRGDKVSRGRLLGKAGVSALDGKSQIMFMVYKNGKPMDPAAAPRD